MTHVVFGLLLYGILVKFGMFPDNQLMIALVSLGSVFPDIDHPKSFVSHLSFWLKIGSRAISVAGHRGPTHTIWALLLSFPVAYIVLKWLGIPGFVGAGAFFIGYLAHLIADSFTKSGVAWFAPLDNHRVRGPVKTGGLFEVVFFFVVVILVLYMFGVSSISSLF